MARKIFKGQQMLPLNLFYLLLRFQACRKRRSWSVRGGQRRNRRPFFAALFSLPYKTPPPVAFSRNGKRIRGRLTVWMQNGLFFHRTGGINQTFNVFSPATGPERDHTRRRGMGGILKFFWLPGSRRGVRRTVWPLQARNSSRSAETGSLAETAGKSQVDTNGSV